jgi:hypothetical protein
MNRAEPVEVNRFGASLRALYKETGKEKNRFPVVPTPKKRFFFNRSFAVPHLCLSQKIEYFKTCLDKLKTFVTY